MKVAVVDVGTNSMRLLITTGEVEIGRWVEVTGLGRGVDRTRRFDQEAIATTLGVLEGFGEMARVEGVERMMAIATSASRDASNREEFFDLAEVALGFRPTLISGEQEARYAYSGAMAGIPGGGVVNDIGGGSTEFVTESAAQSIDIGSVRLTERSLGERPPRPGQLAAAVDLVRSLFEAVTLTSTPRLIGIAGTWTSLAAIALSLAEYDRSVVHGSTIDAETMDHLVDRLSRLDLEETRRIPALDPKRAPVILAGAVIAREAMRCLDAETALVSERDTLDGVAAELLALP